MENLVQFAYSLINEAYILFNQILVHIDYLEIHLMTNPKIPFIVIYIK